MAIRCRSVQRGWVRVDCVWHRRSEVRRGRCCCGRIHRHCCGCGHPSKVLQSDATRENPALLPLAPRLGPWETNLSSRRQASRPLSRFFQRKSKQDGCLRDSVCAVSLVVAERVSVSARAIQTEIGSAEVGGSENPNLRQAVAGVSEQGCLQKRREGG